MKCLIYVYLHIAIFTMFTINSQQQDDGSHRKSCSTRGYISPPPNRIKTKERLIKLRDAMKNEISVEGRAIHAYIITSEDDHQSESVALYDRRREYISGFSGSSGIAIVTYDKAVLWTDGRYHLQADDQLSCDWLLMKVGQSNVPTQVEWLRTNLKNGSRIGADSRLLSHESWKHLKEELKNSQLQFIEVRKNLIDLIWIEGRIPRSNKTAYIWDIQYAGKAWQHKVDEVRSEMMTLGADAIVITALDEIAWLFNIRGRDIPYSPFLRCYVILSLQVIHMYVDSNKITGELRLHLKAETGVNPYSVILHDYDQIWIDIPTLSQIWKNVLLPSSWVYNQGVSEAIYNLVPKEKRLSKPSPIIFLKAQKNEVEIKGMENALIRDSAAMIDFLSYLEKEMKEGKYWDEERVKTELNEFRYEQEYNRGISFETIAAYGPNGAKPHYETTNSTNIPINTTSTLVLDSGGQYLDGTTDVTRTLHFGEPTQEQKIAYTRVLMGCIELSRLIFPSNLATSTVDVLARAPLWRSGLDYMHGTGHGIGAFLGVHESPISVSYTQVKHSQEFKLGFFFSNEPGYYKEGEFGIRLENILEVVSKYPGKVHYSGSKYLGFKDVTLVPYESKLINFHMLTTPQKKWLSAYNTQVRSLVGAELKKQKKMDAFYWMMEKTKNISAGCNPVKKNEFNFFFIIILSSILLI